MDKVYFLILVFLIISSMVLLLPYFFQKNGGKYRIFKGMNFSGIWFLKMFFMNQKTFQTLVTFDESCEVKTLGVQKIFGIGDLLHHNNSDRYGFVYEGNSEFGIYSYQYREGKRIPWIKLGTVKSKEPFFITFPSSIIDKYKMGRYLYPYFEQDGDDEKGAPHKMVMDMEFYELSNIYYNGEQVFELPT